MSHSVELHQVGVSFGATRAVSDVSFTVEGGEFFSILGPSGCGKTTLLRVIAGFLQPTEGKILIGGRDMAALGPNQRPTAMIFQSLALFPLMPVWENIAFGLEARGVSKAERRRKAEELLKLIALEGFGERMPGELSGGQRQRVAIARALAVEPQVLLLDEPLSALDLKLRQHMRAELRALQKRTGVTFIYITHDQSEALAMSDRVAVMSAGVVQQVGAPRELYDNPATPFVATFVGETNAISCTVKSVEDGIAVVDCAHGTLRGRAGAQLTSGGNARLYVRPEALKPGNGAENTLSATIERIDFEGAFALAYGASDDGTRLVASIASTELAAAPAIGARAGFGFDSRNAVVLPHG
ncbi:ABC transporter ATP-binding protein [Nitratireductor sp. ZSWI3]|uniref:ABC transporter ATP-binding protein n=1 Tax=Nitratireductor sp. ZSWI3 TaxID=2966359 RepID=UPI00214FA597|nr:ABC transporter ATP-binding protein [Nitratireductor sp. ZSWI3]MCR4269494.1 ABC transporter ATP-binding protein [Nitratireductor sp. ZSWI3]